MITKKEAEGPLIDHDNLSRISKEIADSSFDKLIIVHGAGSFGHPSAKKYEIGSPITNEEDFTRKKLGLCITQSWV